MARDREPLTDEDWEAFKQVMDAQREEILAALAEDLGGDSEDYRAGRRRPTDTVE